jgi:hypothetical protein
VKHWTPEQIKKWSGCHVIICAGDGNGGIAERIFESSNTEESHALCDAVLGVINGSEPSNKES